MVNAATDLEYNGVFYKEGSKLPKEVADILEIKNPSLLDTYIEVNGKWTEIDDSKISGFVKERKKSEKRLRSYFKIKPEIKAAKEDKSKMLRARPPTPKKYTKEVLDGMSFSKLRKIGDKFGVKGRSKFGLIKDILKVQK